MTEAALASLLTLDFLCRYLASSDKYVITVIQNYFKSFWNICDLAIISFIIGFVVQVFFFDFSSQ